MLNKVQLIGYLGADPEVRFTGGGKAVATLSVATSEKWTNAEGQRQERTEWHRVVVWGKTAENCGQYLQKGRLVYVEGSIKSGEYTDKEGVKRKSFDINAVAVRFLPSGNSGSRQPAQAQEQQGAGFSTDEEDIPF